MSGILALIFWSSTVAFARSLSDSIGIINAAALIFTLSGLIGCLWLLITGELKSIIKLSRLYLFVCGGLFVTYMLCLYLAIGTAATELQAIEAGIINYLWPGLTLAFCVPLLGYRATWALVPATVIGFAGAALAAAGGAGLSWQGFVINMQAHPVPYALALSAAVSWALYSSLTRRLAAGVSSRTVPVFLLASGLVFMIIRPFFHEEAQWSIPALLELSYMVLVPTLLAYSLWDIAMRRGNMILIAAVSYLTPVLSTAISCVYLGVLPHWSLWAGCVLVTAGAVLSRISVREVPGKNLVT